MGDIDEIKIIETESNPWDLQKLTMPLSEVRSASDIERWREHNVEVASYLANYIRHTFFEEGSIGRKSFLSSASPVPKEILQGMELWDSISMASKSEPSFSLDFEEEEGDENIAIEIYDENHPRVQNIKSMERNEELDTEAVHWIADYLGVPLMINYTSKESIRSGQGGHAQAIVRTPYESEDGHWAYDVMDPMSSQTVVRISLEARSREEAFQEISGHVSSNVIGSHLLENRVDINLLEKLTGTPAYDLLISGGISKLQERDVVNCQFMSLLIQAYLWGYYGSFYDFTKGTIPGVSIGEIVNKRFGEVFNVSIKEIFDVMNSVPSFEV